MLIKRRLSLGVPVLAEPILRREQLHDSLRAQDLLAQAEQQAAQLLQETQQQQQAWLDQAAASFWNQANALLQNIEEERAAYRRAALVSVESLLNTALARLLDDTDQTQRIRALLNNLDQGLPHKAEANLSCHPDAAVTVQQWLAEMNLGELWVVHSDPDMAPQALRLSNALGAFDIDWNSLQRGLLATPDSTA